ncbi:MAG TPA: ATP synthase subunit I [Thermoanaerobaculia bacterium]
MRSVPGDRSLRTSAVAAVLAALALGAMGRFRPALALTLGAVVAIVSARWLSLVVGRLQGTGAGEGRKPGWKFALGAGLRYLFVGLAVYGAVRLVPAEPVWLLVGLSSVVLGIVVEGSWDLFRERHKGRTVSPAGRPGPGRTGERI